MNRLIAYRHLEGVNQEQLGKLLGVKAPTISLMESGRRSAETVDVTRLGYTSLEVPNMSEPLHRQRASTKAAATKRARELVRLAGEVFIELREQIARAPECTLQRMPSPTSYADLEDATAEIRCALEHEETGPIRNLTAALERAGVCLVPLEADLLGIDGLSSWVNGVPVIGIKVNLPGDRFRFTLGHELGHLLFHLRRGDNTEHEANRLAGALLIPEADLEEAMAGRTTLRDFIALKSSWGISVAALVYRAHEMGHIDDSRYRSLQIQMSKWRKSEPGEFEPVPGQLLPRLVEVGGGIDSVSRALGVNRDHLRDVVSWSHLRAA